ncbi:MAG: imidazolonepropionase [Bradymonadaceae bacterium]|nr:imidazolonepropionase [Lujinxingiaceae bacterium]
MQNNTVLIHARQMLTMPDVVEQLRDYDPQGDVEARDEAIAGVVHDAGILIKGGKIAWLGPWAERPKGSDKGGVFETGVVTPGWIDCHTHALFAGERSAEFALRNAGRSYLEILESGGGILNTVDAVRATSRKQLADELGARIFDSVRLGVTTLEVKSGYGLTTDDELKSLRAIADVASDVPCELVACFLGAHAIPREYRERRAAYVDLVCKEMIPKVKESQLANYCDVFCDRGAFDAAEAERILVAGQEHGLIARIHADELSNAGAAMLAARLGAASADHLEHTPDDAILAMSKAGVTGVLMPAVNLFLNTLDHLAPARKLLNAGCEIAVATDFNPGSAMTQDLGLMLTLACTLYKLTPGEALRSVTLGAARALRRDDIGRLRVGTRANLAMFDVPHYRYIPYHFGKSHVEGVIYDGEFVYWTEDEPID